MQKYKLKKGSVHWIRGNRTRKGGKLRGRGMVKLVGPAEVELDDHQVKAFKDKFMPISVEVKKEKEPEPETGKEEESPKEKFEIVERSDGEGFNLVNTETGTALNDEALTREEAERLMEQFKNG